MSLIKFEKFRGQAPIASPTRLMPGQAQSAENCRFEGGLLKPLRDTSQVQAAPDGTDTYTIYYYPPTDVWLTWDRVVDVQRSMVAQDSYNRVFWTDPYGEGMRFADASMVGLSPGPFPQSSAVVGVPAPATAPTVAVVGSPDDPNDLPDSRYYVFTYVDYWGQEGPPSPVSAMVDVYPGQTVDLSDLGTESPSALYQITRKRIYRTNSGLTGAVFQLVDDIVIADDTYNDAKLAINLEDELITEDFDLPDPVMEGLVTHPNGFFAAYHGTALYFSEPGYPYAWPVKYQLGIDYNIMGFGVVASSIVVATTGTPYILDGGHPQSMSVRRIEENQACVSRRGVVDMGYAICYPSPDGLVAVNPAGVKVVTETLFSRDQWTALKPSSFVASLWEGKYLCCYDTGTAQGSFVLDPSNPDLGVVFFDTVFTAAHNYLIDDYLYLCVDGDIVSWDSDDALSYTWRSGKIQSPRPINAGVLQIRADSYPVTLTLYADGVRRWRGTVYNNKATRLPAGYLGEQWEVELTGTGEVYEVLLGESMVDMRGV